MPHSQSATNPYIKIKPDVRPHSPLLKLRSRSPSRERWRLKNVRQWNPRLFAFCCIFWASILFFFRALFLPDPVSINDDTLAPEAVTELDEPALPFMDVSNFAEGTSRKPFLLDPTVLYKHPIPRLMAKAEQTFQRKVARQSKSLAEAVAEYRRRYGRAPPRGFDDWFEFAISHNVTMIDEYDGLVEDLAPFWHLPGKEVRDRAMQASFLPSIGLVKVEDGDVYLWDPNGTVAGEAAVRARGFARQFRPFQHRLPDMVFPVNGKAEARVVIPWEKRDIQNSSEMQASLGIETLLGVNFTSDWRGRGSVWEAYRNHCSPDTNARAIFPLKRHRGGVLHYPENPDDSIVSSPRPFVFAEDADFDFDWCKDPWSHAYQGLFFSDFRTIPVLFPVFSYGKSHGYSDIRIPSHYYYAPSSAYTYGVSGGTNRRAVLDVDEMEVPWDEKTNKVWWRGAPRGGSAPGGFAKWYHRHRFVGMTNSNSTEVTRDVVFLDPVTGQYTNRSLSMNELNTVMDAAFNHVTMASGYKGGLKALRQDYRFGDVVALGESWKHKFLMDLDGVGYSARFFAFLESDSVPLKTTVYKEYFEGWIQPWLHYIPLSQSYDELYNIHAFFSKPSEVMLTAPLAGEINAFPNEILQLAPLQEHPDGDVLLQHIAQEGKKWKRANARQHEIHAYTYRLCLEWARLWSDNRDLMDYHPSTEELENRNATIFKQEKVSL